MDDAPWARGLAAGFVVGGVALAWFGVGLLGLSWLAPGLCTAMYCWAPSTLADYVYVYLPEIVMLALGAELVLGGLLGLRAHPRVSVVPPSGWETPLEPGGKAVKVKLVRRPAWRRVENFGAACAIAASPTGLLISLPLAFGNGIDLYAVASSPEYHLLYYLVTYPPLIGIVGGIATIATAVVMERARVLRKPTVKPAKTR